VLKVVIDANVWVSSLWGDGKPRRIRERFEQGHFQLFFATELLAECREVLARPKFAERIDARQSAFVLELIRKKATFVQLPDPIPAVSRDPDDDMYLACAGVADCDYIVTGDPHLLDLQKHGRTQIVRPAVFLSILEN
jgi:putative PIN family toxin of toxin-antitoxin system